MTNSRTPAQQAEAERRWIARLMMGEHPDAAIRAVGITPLEAGRAIKDRWRHHLAIICKAAGASMQTGERVLQRQRDAHRGRLAELIYVAMMDEEARQRRPEAPTAERLSHGDLKEGRAKAPDDPRGKAEVRVWVERRPTPIHDAYERGQVTAVQLEAARRIEELAYVAYGSGCTRSCIDTTPSGSGGSGAAQAAASADLHALSLDMGDARDACLGVVVFHQPTGPRAVNRKRWQRVLAGLNIAAEFFDQGPLTRVSKYGTET